MDNQVGNFEVGKEFDALIVDTDVSDGLLNNLQSSRYFMFIPMYNSLYIRYI